MGAEWEAEGTGAVGGPSWRAGPRLTCKYDKLWTEVSGSVPLHLVRTLCRFLIAPSPCTHVRSLGALLWHCLGPACVSGSASLSLFVCLSVFHFRALSARWPAGLPSSLWSPRSSLPRVCPGLIRRYTAIRQHEAKTLCHSRKTLRSCCSSIGCGSSPCATLRRKLFRYFLAQPCTEAVELTLFP